MSLPSERELIARWRAAIPVGSPGVILGPGDDAALVTLDADRLGVLTTDILVEGVHFRRDWGEPADLGWKAAAVNLSDLAAMGATPRYLVASTALPPDLAVAYADGVVRGLVECAGAFDAALVGGDTVRSSGPYVVAVAAFGEVERDHVLRRDAARAGEVVAVTGLFGGAAAALRVLRAASRPEGALFTRLLRPSPRIAEARALARAGVRCAIDSSDGLGRSASLIAEASGCALEIDGAHLPVQSGATLEDALRGGEDYELVLVAPEATLRASGVPVTIVGRALAGRGAWLVRPDGSREDLADAGYDGFASG